RNDLGARADRHRRATLDRGRLGGPRRPSGLSAREQHVARRHQFAAHRARGEREVKYIVAILLLLGCVVAACGLMAQYRTVSELYISVDDFTLKSTSYFAVPELEVRVSTEKQVLSSMAGIEELKSLGLVPSGTQREQGWLFVRGTRCGTRGWRGPGVPVYRM